MSVLPDLLTVVTLENEFARLEPLSMNHCSDLQEAVIGLENLWYVAGKNKIPTPETVFAEVERRIKGFETREWLPFAAVNPKTGKAMGLTRLMHMDFNSRRLEIGGTWMAQSTHGTGFNLACKHLLLQHSFDTLKCIAVELRTHRINFQSQKAIEKLGAKLDGILRNHQLLENGTLRDTMVYSIIDNEWSTVDAHLRYQLSKLKKA